MARKTVDFVEITKPDRLASQIAEKYQCWDSARSPRLARWQELRDYVFATDTTTTSNASLPWHNKTTLPKLCQIRDNLHANYMATLFPNEDWLDWAGSTQDDVADKKRRKIKDYMLTKLDDGDFQTVMSQSLLDWIDYGNCFATTDYVREVYVNDDGDVCTAYEGPKAVRISPMDIVFDICASSFKDAPKIRRTLCTLGELKARIEDVPEAGYLSEAFTKAMEVREKFSGLTHTDTIKNSASINDGTGSILMYMQGDTVELLDFYGSIYDTDSGELLSNYLITVMDRTRIIRKMANPSWLGRDPVHHCGWRLRPDSLIAMGPLENLVGMQYRIDHLENMKADAFDMIAHPITKVKGIVEEFTMRPGETITCSEDGDVSFLHPDTTALNADFQIQALESRMEEYAGAPKQAMGIRTPGEKTKYEVQILENSASRIFQHQIARFEKVFMEPLVNDMLEVARRNMNGIDVARTIMDPEGIIVFTSIKKEDIQGKGRLKPKGARHFAYKANLLQNLTGLLQSPIGQDPSINVHLSGIRIARLAEEAADLRKFDIVKENVRIDENRATQEKLKRTQEDMMAQDSLPDARDVVLEEALGEG